MKKYTISVCYYLGHLQDIEVEANSLEDACEKAIDEADDSANWRQCDEPMPSFIDGIYEGTTPTGRYWDKPTDAPDDPPTPAAFSELTVMYSKDALCLALFGYPLDHVLDILTEARRGEADSKDILKLTHNATS